MAKLLSLRVGFSDAPDKVRPTLNDCLVAVIEYAELLMEEVIDGLALARQPTGSLRNPALREPAVKRAIGHLQKNIEEACADFRGELSRLVYEGGAAEPSATRAVRFEDLQFLDALQLDRNIELARAQQELQIAVEDVLPPFDACVSTLLGWRTVQPELNPLRPDVFVRALHAVLMLHVGEETTREALIVPAAGLLGVNVRRSYRELSAWLRNSGVEPAVPAGGTIHRSGRLRAAPAQESLTRSLLTLDRLRLLMTGAFQSEASGAARSDFLDTLPAPMELLQDPRQVDSFVSRLAQRARRVGRPDPIPAAQDPAARARLGRELGEEVIRQMFENLAHDARLLPGYKARLRRIEPAIIKLGRHDSRFFSDPQHPARRLLDRLTERSLGFKTEADEGCGRFLVTAEMAVRWLEADAIDAEVFSELLDYLEAEWARQDRRLLERRAQEALVLMRTEQRDQLIKRFAAEFAQICARRPVPPFVAELLHEAWPRVVAQARLACTGDVDDPGGYRALASELIWSVQRKQNARPARTRRLAAVIPGLLAGLRGGLASIGYPAARADLFFDQLMTVHQAALQEGREAAPTAAPPGGADSVAEAAWRRLAPGEVLDSRDSSQAAQDSEDSVGQTDGPAALPELRPGCWVDLMVDAQWLRVQLTWASPGSTQFMFISPAGTAHSMSRRTLERLRTKDQMRVVADRSPVEEALDGVAQAALANTLGRGPEGAGRPGRCAAGLQGG